MTEQQANKTTPRTRSPLLGRLGVGAKLMLFVLLPVGVLLGFTIAGAVGNWRTASSLRDFENATEQSFVVSDLATALADERTAAALVILRPNSDAAQRLRAAQAGVDAELQKASAQASAWPGPVDLGGRLDAARRQLNAVRVEVTSGSLNVPDASEAYSAIVGNLTGTIRQLGGSAPTQRSARPADAYVAIVEATEAAAREQVDVAAVLATPTPTPLTASTAARWSVLEAAQLDIFRENAAGPLAADLETVRFSPPGVTVAAVRDDLVGGALSASPGPSLNGWLDASGARIASLRGLQAGARQNLASTASADSGAAQAHGFRDLAISLGVLLVVIGLALALRRSITRPLGEVSQGAQSLSRGDLTFDIGYRGRDEIGRVATAFRQLHVTAQRLATDIREMAAAVRENRLEHRADVTAFEGTWSQLLAGLNDTMAAFADLEGRRERAERELADFFDLSLDLFCIGGPNGVFSRVNPAFERTLGYPAGELTSRPFVEFIHPDDRKRTVEAFASQLAGTELIGFENRYICDDGSVRWLQWTARASSSEEIAVAVARDITERRRNEDEQAALRRVATLVAIGVSPAETFSAVAAEVGQLFGAEVATVFRYEPKREATLVGGWSVPGIEIPIGCRLLVTGTGVAVRVLDTRRPVRMERFEGPPGSIPAFFQSAGAQSGVGAPIMVEGRLWGVLVAVSIQRERMPAGMELATARFTDLLATAISNAQAREELRRVADEQAALRRVATLVAAADPPSAVFARVAEEVGRLLAVDQAYVARYEAEGTLTVLAAWSLSGETPPIGQRSEAPEGGVGALVRETGQPCRVDRYDGEARSTALASGIRTAVGAPITVKGQLWGLIVVASTGDEPPPPETEARLSDFTELVAIAIANADAQAELTASRARVVATADQTRRQIERNLHDGAQQRLVTLVLHLRDARAGLPAEAEELGAQINQAIAVAGAALDELRELARGIHPAMLSKGGLRPALTALARNCPIPVELEVGWAERAPEQVEVAAYYVAAEALTNAVKYASASGVRVAVAHNEGALCVDISDDGIGGADAARGSGLVGLRDRVEALGGKLSLHSPTGEGTALHVELPLHTHAHQQENHESR